MRRCSLLLAALVLTFSSLPLACGELVKDESTSSTPSVDASLFAAWFRMLGTRSLAAGQDDFERFNVLLAGAKMSLPDASSSQRAVFADLDVNLQDMHCQNVRLDEFNVTVASQDAVSVTLDAFVQADLTCFASYHYHYGIFRGSGQVDVYATNSQLRVSVQLSSESTLDQAPPSLATIPNCWASIDVTHLDFHGGMVAGIADLFQGVISRAVEGAANGEACQKIVTVAPTLFTAGMGRVQAQLDKVLQPVPSDRSDPLFLEHQLVKATNATSPLLVNFQQQGSMGGWFSSGLREVDRFLAKKVDDNTTNTTTSGYHQDVAANVWLRHRVLDPDRCWRGSLASLGGGGDAVAANASTFRMSDSVTDTIVTVDSVRLCGLDTLQSILVARPVGQHTFRNEFSWQYLTLQLDMTVDMKPSTSNDSVWIDPGSGHVVERIQLTLGAEQVAINLTTLMAMDQEAVLDLQLGSLLRSENLVPCFLSVLDDIGVAGLEATVGNLLEPTLAGFVSPGLDRLINSLTNVAFLAYEPTLIRALSGAFRGPIRDALDRQISDRVIAGPGAASCPVPRLGNASAEALIDFRDLLVSPESSAALGGSGMQPYGDVGSMSYTAVNERMNELESDGMPAINEALIRPLTKAQSGEDGVLRFNDSVLSFMMRGYTLNFTDIRIRNLDSIASNLTLLEPTYDPSLLENMASLGASSDRDVSVVVRMTIASDIADHEALRVYNDLDVQATVSSIDVLAGIVAKLQTGSLLSLPLRYVLNSDCWMSVVTGRDETGPGLELLAFLLRLTSLRISSSCISCSSSGTSVLPQLFQILQDTGSFKVLGGRVEQFVASFVASDTAQAFLSAKVSEARHLCPLSPAYNSTAVRSNSSVGIPSLSAEDIDTILFVAATTSAITSVVMAQGHLHSQTHATTERPKPRMNESSLLDWTDLPGSLGTFGALLDEASTSFRTYLGSPDSQGRLRINSLQEDSILDDGVLSLDPGFRIRIGETDVALEVVRVSGLDKFTQFDALKPLSSRTLRTELFLETISVTVGLVVGNESSIVPPARLLLDVQAVNVSVVVDTIVALDWQSLGAIAIGSILNTSSILPCLLSTIKGLSVSRFVASAESYSTPRFRGLKDDTSSTLDATIDRLQQQFGSTFARAIPSIFNTTLRELVNVWTQGYVSDTSNSRCPNPLFDGKSQGYLDFRDLLLQSVEAKRLGGSGTSRYGDLFSRGYEVFSKLFLTTDVTSGLATTLNSGVVARLTKRESGEEGALRYEGDLVNFNSSLRLGGLDAKATLRISDVALVNLNTFGAPLSLFEPVSVPSLLNNTASIGIGPPVRAGARLLFGLAGNGTFEVHCVWILLLDFASPIASFQSRRFGTTLLSVSISRT
jgi:hypothetical protein